MVSNRLPPHDINAEESVLGSILIDKESLITVSGILGPKDFYREKNKWVFESMLEVYNRGDAIDQVTIANELVNQGNLEELGGSAYLAYLISIVPSSVHVKEYATVIAKTSQLRQLIKAGSEIVDIGFTDTSDVTNSYGKAEKILFDLKDGRSSEDFTHLKDVLEQYMKETANLKGDPDSAMAPVTTGFEDMDRILSGGLQNSDLVVLAARPSLGKSTLAFNIAREASVSGKTVGIFSLEMSSDQLGQRLLTSEARVDNALVRRGSPNIKWKNINIASGKLAQAPLYIDDTPALSILDLRSRARRLKRERNIELLIVDYLQLMQGPKNSENRQNEISQITQSLKALAKELDIPVIALSQLSRAVEQRTKKEPMLSDLRESGAIEQDADVVIFLYRPAVYDKEDQDLKGLAYLIVAKQRNGPTGRVTATFIDTYARFDNHQEF